MENKKNQKTLNSFNFMGTLPMSVKGIVRLLLAFILLLSFAAPSPCLQGKKSQHECPNPVQRIAGVDANAVREAIALIKEGESNLAFTRLGYRPDAKPGAASTLRQAVAWAVLEVADSFGVLPG